MIEQQLAASRARIWLLFDGSPGSQAALLQALPFAQDSGRELRAMYVEDLSLVRCSGLGLTREVGAVSGVLRTQNETSHRYAQAVRLRRAQRCLDHLLGLAPGQSLALESHRGRPIEVLASLVQPDDWVVAGRGGYANRRAGRLGSLTRCLIEQLPSTLLIGSPSGVVHAGPWLLLLDERSDLASQINAAAAALGTAGRAMIAVHPQGLAQRLRHEIEVSSSLTLTWLTSRVSGALALQKVIQDHQIAGLLASDAHPLIQPSEATNGWVAVDRPLLIIRP